MKECQLSLPINLEKMIASDDEADYLVDKHQTRRYFADTNCSRIAIYALRAERIR